jgi:predicted nuclease of predicted toxin-antitoxin system
MRFLVDECCDPRLADALLDAGHDAVWWRIVSPGASDAALLAAAQAEGRIVVTHDVGIGGMAIRQGMAVPGLVIVRVRPRDRREVATRLLSLVAECGDDLLGSVTVLGDQGYRKRLIRD